MLTFHNSNPFAFPFDLQRNLFADAEPQREARSPKFFWKDLGDAYVLSADVPGLTEKDVTITLEEDVVKVSGERKEAPESALRGYAFERSIRFGHAIDVEASTAVVKDGVLTLRLVKAKLETAKSIPVRGG